MQPHLKAERENIHLPLDPKKTYTVRLTFLLGELFPILYNALMQFNATGEDSPSFLRLGKQRFLLEEVLLSRDEPTGWTGVTSLMALIEKAQQTRLDSNTPLTLEFASLTTFNRGNSKTGYGSFPVMLPLPQFLFQNLLKRWEDTIPPELSFLIQTELIEQYLQEDGVIIVDYDLKAHYVHFTTHLQRGFLGTCTYQLRGPQRKPSPESPLTLRQQLYLLTQLAFYSGVGYKTAMGLGQVRLLQPR
jgi:CRISPR-associated endoribonuclease Cas6